jgi:unsaturated chondroitin disaccharide hydrolase
MGNSLVVKSAAAISLIFAPVQHTLAGGRLDSLVSNALKLSLVHLEHSISEVGDTTLYPTHGTSELRWKLRGADDWTSGFYPGCLWYAFEISKDPRFERWARQWTAALEPEKLNTETHDLGFKFMCSFGNGLRLGNGSNAGKYREIMLTAAKTLASRFDPHVGCLRSNWDVLHAQNSFPVIIDIMMNLELLFWASQNGGPAYCADYALTHAVTTCRDFVRSDGSTYHIVRYDSSTGKVINKGTLQGAGDESTWARG